MHSNFKTKYIAIIITLMSAFGCLPESLPVDNIPVLDERIVVSSQILTSNSVSLLLTKSFGALDVSEGSDLQDLINEIAINDATAVISGNENTDTLTFLGNGIYASANIPLVEGDLYHLHIESPTMGVVRASTTVQKFVPFEEVSARIFDGGFDSLAQVSYVFEDIPDEQNYYMVNATHIELQEFEDPSELLNPNVTTKLLEDSDVVNGKLNDSFSVLFQGDQSIGDTLIIQLSQISQGYHEYLTLRNDGQLNISEFIGEPVNYPSNIENGLGWFNLHVPDVRIVIVEE